jgi:ribosomal protein S18 acetylase RimI-like enzyme
MSFLCQPAEESHADQISDFNCRLALETEGKVLDATTVRNGVIRGLALMPEVRYFVAVKDSVIIGQLMLTREWSDWRDGWIVWLQSVYVVPEFRGLGIFRQLLKLALQTVTAEFSVVSVRLYVEHANETAKRCYHKLGFRGAGYEVLEMSGPPDSADLRIL